MAAKALAKKTTKRSQYQVSNSKDMKNIIQLGLKNKLDVKVIDNKKFIFDVSQGNEQALKNLATKNKIKVTFLKTSEVSINQAKKIQINNPGKGTSGGSTTPGASTNPGSSTAPGATAPKGNTTPGAANIPGGTAKPGISTNTGGGNNQNGTGTDKKESGSNALLWGLIAVGIGLTGYYLTGNDETAENAKNKKAA